MNMEVGVSHAPVVQTPVRVYQMAEVQRTVEEMRNSMRSGNKDSRQITVRNEAWGKEFSVIGMYAILQH